MSLNYVQNECQPSGHRLSHQTIAKLRQLMVREGLRARMSAVVQLWSKTTTANLWLMIHKKIVCVITDGTDGQDFCFVRFYDHNLKTIHFEVDLNQDFVFETRSSVFYVLSGSDGQSIGIKFGDKLIAYDFKIIVMERRVKQFKQLSECKPSPDLPSDDLKPKVLHRILGPIRSHTLPKTSNSKNRFSRITNGSVVGLQSDSTLETMVEKGFIHEDSDEEHTTITSKANQPIDISLSVVDESGKGMDTSVIAVGNQSITGTDSNKDSELPESVSKVSNNLMAKTANGHELVTNENSDPIRDTEEVAEDIVTQVSDNHSNGGSNGNDEEYDVFIGSWLNKHMINVRQGLSFWNNNRKTITRSGDVQNNRKHRPQRRVIIPVDSVTYKRFLNVIVDKSLVRVFITSDTMRSKLDYESHDNLVAITAKYPRISVDSEIYNRIRDNVAIYGNKLRNTLIFITNAPKFPYLSEKLAEAAGDCDNTVIESNDNQSDGGIDDYDKEYDVILYSLSERHIRVGRGSTFWRRYHLATNEARDDHNDGQQEPQRRVIPVDSETYNRFREVMGDTKFASLVMIRNNSLRLALYEETDDGHSVRKDKAEMPVISVESTLYKQIRDVVAIYGDITSDHQVVITTDSHSGGESDGNDEEFDVFISRSLFNKRKINVCKGYELWSKRATEVLRDGKNRGKYVDRLILVDLDTFKRFRKVIKDTTGNYFIYVFIKNDSSMSKPDDESHDGHSKRNDPLIPVDSQTYKQIRNVLARNANSPINHRVVITIDSMWSKLIKKLGRKFCWCFP